MARRSSITAWRQLLWRSSARPALLLATPTWLAVVLVGNLVLGPNAMDFEDLATLLAESRTLRVAVLCGVLLGMYPGYLVAVGGRGMAYLRSLPLSPHLGALYLSVLAALLFSPFALLMLAGGRPLLALAFVAWSAGTLAIFVAGRWVLGLFSMQTMAVFPSHFAIWGSAIGVLALLVFVPRLWSEGRNKRGEELLLVGARRVILLIGNLGVAHLVRREKGVLVRVVLTGLVSAALLQLFSPASDIAVALLTPGMILIALFISAALVRDIRFSLPLYLSMGTPPWKLYLGSVLVVLGIQVPMQVVITFLGGGSALTAVFALAHAAFWSLLCLDLAWQTQGKRERQGRPIGILVAVFFVVLGFLAAYGHDVLLLLAAGIPLLLLSTAGRIPLERVSEC